MIENFEECLVGDFVAYSDSNKDCFGKVKEVREESLLVSPPGQPFDEKEVDSNQVLAVWREAKLDLLEDPPFGFMKLRYDDYVVYESFDPYEYWFDDDEMVFPKATGFIHTIGFEAVGVEDD